MNILMPPIPMNFKIKRLFVITSHVLVGFFLIFLGIFTIASSWSSFLQNATINLLRSEGKLLFISGLVFSVIGLATINLAYQKISQRQVFICLGPYAVALNKKLIEKYLAIIWKQHFPKHKLSYDVILKTKCIQILVDFPESIEDERADILASVQTNLENLFRNTLGYSQEVHLIANFYSHSSTPLNGKNKI